VNWKAQQTLLELCNHKWRRIRSRLTYVDLPSADWDDIKQKAMTQVFMMYHRFRKSRGTLQAWSWTVMDRSVFNSIRDLIGYKTPRAKWYRAIRYAWPLKIRVRQLNQFGEEAVVIEPDVIDDFVGRITWDQDEMDEFCRRLSQHERSVMMGLMKRRTCGEIAARTGIDYQTVLKITKRLPVLFQEFNEPKSAEIVTEMVDLAIRRNRTKIAEIRRKSEAKIVAKMFYIKGQAKWVQKENGEWDCVYQTHEKSCKKPVDISRQSCQSDGKST